MHAGKTVIIIAKRTDIHAISVAGEVRASFNGEAVILDSADYPTLWQLTMSARSDRKPTWTLRGSGWESNSEEVAGVWWRRPERHRISRQVKGSKIRSFCEDEAAMAFRGWIHGLGEKVVNPLAAEYAANRKPFQLLKAAEAGLRIPHTLITNDPQEARSFLDSLKGSAIFKVLTGTSWQFTETRRFMKKYSQYLESLRHAPVIFQELIEAQRDIRVTIVDETVFAVSIKPVHPGAVLDWRMDLAAEMQSHKLPRAIKRKLIDLMRSLGLRFGAIDLRLTHENEYVFLEVNPSGQFLFCEIHAGQAVSRALAASLLGIKQPAR